MTIDNIPNILVVGKQGFFIEGAFFCIVHIVSTDVSNSILRVKLKPVEAKGVNADGSAFQVAAKEGILNISPKKVSARYVGWRLYLDRKIIDKAMDIVSSLPKGMLVSEDYISVPAEKGSKFVAHNSVGPVLLEFNKFIENIDSI